MKGQVSLELLLAFLLLLVFYYLFLQGFAEFEAGVVRGVDSLEDSVIDSFCGLLIDKALLNSLTVNGLECAFDANSVNSIAVRRGVFFDEYL